MGIQIHLKELLRERGMTGKELAAKLDITEANLSIFVSGKSKASGITGKNENNIRYIQRRSCSGSSFGHKKF